MEPQIITIYFAGKRLVWIATLRRIANNRSMPLYIVYFTKEYKLYKIEDRSIHK